MAKSIDTRCCIVGGGPCGLMLGYLLARAGVDVVVLEKHADFLRDFRGDTIHPSTLELMHELGLLDDFLKLPHQPARTVGAWFGDKEYTLADFNHLPTRCKYVALMPQWDFLNFLAERGRKYPTFRLLMRTEATDLRLEGDRVVGVRAKAPDGDVDIRADLTVGCDGRGSIIRARAGLKLDELGAPMDALWFRMPKRADDPLKTMGRFDAGRILILLDRGDYWQIAYVIPKGTIDETRRAGLAAFGQDIARLVPVFADRVGSLTDWDQVKLLTVQVNRLTTWHREGLLCIGDAAHAMSPVGGVGVNLAVQDAVAAANRLWQPLNSRTVKRSDLAAVQERREFPTRVTQRIQVIAQNNVINPALNATEAPRPPLLLRIISAIPLLQRIPARVLGLGVRFEHVRTPDVATAATA